MTDWLPLVVALVVLWAGFGLFTWSLCRMSASGDRNADS